MKTKFIFVTGGVVSSLGKGINASSIGKLLKEHGLKVFMQKFDPYINVDPGNMSPLQHGEVYVTDDGAETDLDLGHYERFIDERLNKHSSVTSGKIYSTVIENERKGKYDGGTVQVIPHITNEIKMRLINGALSSDADIVITEIGGTVGDIECLPYLEAIRQFRRDIGYNNTFYIHNTLVPFVKASKEIKTKPTQHSVKELRSLGINPDMLILRTEISLDEGTKEKVALFCDVNKDAVIEAVDVDTIYEIPVKFANQRVDEIILKHFKMDALPLNLSSWLEMVEHIKNLKDIVKIALVGQHVDTKDSYISISESLKHAGFFNDVLVEIIPIKPCELEKDATILSNYNGVVIPDGFGVDYIDGLFNAIKYAREEKIPTLGIGYGMELMVIEYVRNVLGYMDANSTEIDANTNFPLFKYAKKNDLPNKEMRLGLHEILIKDHTLAKTIYNASTIKERHRHQYEFANEYLDILKDTNLIVSGVHKDENVMEVIELNNHPFYFGVLYHPEYISRPNRAHPVFIEFIKNAKIK